MFLLDNYSILKLVIYSRNVQTRKWQFRAEFLHRQSRTITVFWRQWRSTINCYCKHPVAFCIPRSSASCASVRSCAFLIDLKLRASGFFSRLPLSSEQTKGTSPSRILRSELCFAFCTCSCFCFESCFVSEDSEAAFISKKMRQLVERRCL